jgi:hypothetical protein
MAPLAGPLPEPAPALGPAREKPHEAPQGEHGLCMRTGQRGHLVRSAHEPVPARRSRWVSDVVLRGPSGRARLRLGLRGCEGAWGGIRW